jgi:hypothetical protein
VPRPCAERHMIKEPTESQSAWTLARVGESKHIKRLMGGQRSNRLHLIGHTESCYFLFKKKENHGLVKSTLVGKK